MTTQPDDYDSPWKEILETYFEDFIAFFFPNAYIDINWQKRYEFLDKELQQITKDAESGRKYVDKLARVYLKSGEEAWALIHSDIQVQREADFNKRMYTYNYRLFDKYQRHAASFAVIGEAGRWHPGRFEQERWGCDIRFRFPVIRLSGYKNRLDELLESINPFAFVAAAHILTQQTSDDKTRRRHEKMTLIRLLYKKQFSRQDIINLFRFIDWIMQLPELEETLFWKELTDYEGERKMPYITSVERIGYKRGIKEGIQQGMLEGRQEGKQEGETVMLSKMIATKFRLNSKEVWTLITPLSPELIEKLTEQFFVFESSDDFFQWIAKNTEQDKV